MVKNVTGIVVNTNLHSTGQIGLCESYSANTLGSSIVVFSFKGNIAYDQDFVPLLVRGEGEKKKESNPYAILYDLFPSVAYGITDYLDISISQPLYFDILEGPLPTGGLGDLHCTVKYKIPVKMVNLFNGALLTSATFPYPDNKNGYFMRHLYYLPKHDDNVISKPIAFYSARKPSLSLIAIATLTKNMFNFHANFGASMSFNETLDRIVIGALGVEIHLNEWLNVLSDIYCEPRFESITDNATITGDPFHLSIGASIKASGGALFTIGSTFRLSSNEEVLHYFNHSEKLWIHARTEPFWKGYVQFTWSGSFVQKDRDRDQIKDRSDECPDIPEDIDGFKDHDGCPDNDNDQDKIPDESDSCKNVPEDIDGYNDLDGCPDEDNDGDGIPDTLDRCPDVAEDKDGFLDDDGCPDFDNDSDGIPDSIDKCIMIPEDIDGFDDIDGCPDIDNDEDGILDSCDQCPESVGIAKNNGCPKMHEKGKEIKFGRLILPGVHFNKETSELTSGSLVELDRLFLSLSDWPEVKIEIQAHVDDSIVPQDAIVLSQNRAEAVLAYLTNKGIANIRLNAVGKGSTSPIADNGTIEGRKLNSRVEIHRIRNRK